MARDRQAPSVQLHRYNTTTTNINNANTNNNMLQHPR
jgi:hypothetical protein